VLLGIKAVMEILNQTNKFLIDPKNKIHFRKTRISNQIQICIRVVYLNGSVFLIEVFMATVV